MAANVRALNRKSYGNTVPFARICRTGNAVTCDYAQKVFSTPPPGAIGLTHLYGWPNLKATLGHALLGDHTDHNSVIVVVDRRRVMETWPSGARLRPLSQYTDEYVIYGWPRTLTSDQGTAVAKAALSLDGARFGVADYLAARLARGGSRRAAVRHRLGDPHRLLPSRFVTETYRRAGLRIMPDGLVPTLAQVGELFMSSGWEMWVPAAQYV